MTPLSSLSRRDRIAELLDGLIGSAEAAGYRWSHLSLGLACARGPLTEAGGLVRFEVEHVTLPNGNGVWRWRAEMAPPSGAGAIELGTSMTGDAAAAAAVGAAHRWLQRQRGGEV